MRVRELAERLGLTFEGDGENEIEGAAELERAGGRELSFVAARKFWKLAEASAAGCLIVTMEFPSTGRSLIRAVEPRGAFAASLRILYKKASFKPGIHASTVIEEGVTLGIDVYVGPHTLLAAGARIGDRVQIHAGCAVGRNVAIGADSLLHPRVTIYEGVVIGERVILHSGAVIGADGFGFVPVDGAWQKFPQVGGVKIGDDVEIGANSCVDRAALGLTWIGDGVKLDNMVHIAHNCQIGDHVVIAAQTGLSGGVVVGNQAIIGGQVGIGDKARIESGAVLGSGCGILTSKIVRAGQPVWGTPARPLREYLEQLALVARLPQMKEELRQIQTIVQDLSERLGLPQQARGESDRSDE